jgi:hypothetical protein
MSAEANQRLCRNLQTLLLCLLLTLPTFCSGMPKPVLSTTHRTEMSVDRPSGHEGTICSATAIGPHALLTATHCDLGSALVTIDDGVPTAIISRTNDRDDHTIYFVAATFPAWAHLSTSRPNIGDEVWLRGNPDGLNQLVRRGILSGYVVNVDEIVQMFDINGWQGDSGSAIFNSSGEIIAVVSYGFVAGGFTMLGCLELRFSQTQLLAAEK